MELTTIRELFKDRESYLGKKVTIGGWVRSLRDSKTFGFIVVNDGSYFEPLQIVYHDEMENFAEVSKLNVGAAIIVKGTLVATPQAKQPFEIQADEVQIEGASASDYPLQKKRHTFEYLRTISHLRPRTNTFQAVFRVRSLAAYAIHKFFQERGFVYVHTPLITGSDCEGAGEMFRVTTLDMDQIPKNEDRIMSEQNTDVKSLAHTKWNCKYHVVFAPKYRRKVFYNEKKEAIREIIRTLCQWKGVEIIEEEVCPDHIHLLLSIPPKMSVSGFMGYLKGKSSLMIFQRFGNMKFAYRNREFWCKGYYVDTVGKNTAAIKSYIANQLKQDKEMDQISLFDPRDPFTGSK